MGRKTLTRSIRCVAHL